MVLWQVWLRQLIVVFIFPILDFNDVFFRIFGINYFNDT